MAFVDVAEALRQTRKGQLKYDRTGIIGLQEELGTLNQRKNSLAFGLIQNSIQDEVEIGVEMGLLNSPSESFALFNGNDNKNEAAMMSGSINEMTLTRHLELLLLQMEEERKEGVKAMTTRKRLEFQEHQQKLIEDEKLQLKYLQEKHKKEQEFFKEKYLAEEAAGNEEIIQLEQNQRQRLDYNNQIINAKIKEAVQTQKQLEAEIQERINLKKQQDKFAVTIHECQKAIGHHYHTMAEALKSCCDISLLPESVKESIAKQKDIPVTFARLVNAAKNSNLTANDATLAVNLVHEFEGCIQMMLEAIASINTSIASSQNVSNDFQEATVPEVVVSQTPPLEAPEPLSKNSPQKEDNINTEDSLSMHLTENDDSEKLSDYSNCSFCISPSALQEYIRLQNYRKAIQNSYQQLQTDSTGKPNSQLKKYRFDLQKAVNIPVNAISPLSGQHVKDKLARLKKLLNGETVEIANSRVSASHHPQAIPMCKDLLARKIVKQGEEQVASKFETAFSIAAVVIGLWCDFPDFGDLLLAHFHEKCPYIVPFYIPRLAEQSEQTHYKALGYTYTNGAIEKQDMFLKRMSGLMRLYCSILCTSVPHGINHPHPHGIKHGWKWMSRILNLEPRPDITATLLFDFLETTGFAMQETYGSQFEKLLCTLYNEFLPKIKEVTAAGSGGPVTRLENFLTNYKRDRRIPPPAGRLPHNFWFT